MRIKTKVRRAFKRFMEVERALLSAKTNERSLTHRLAIQVERLFPQYDVDCEYNRDGNIPKRLDAFRRPSVPSDDTDGVTVYPDIIVHRRGQRANIVVIEAKLSSNNLPCVLPQTCHCDRCKLRAYRAEFGYAYAFYVVFPVGRKLSAYSGASIGEYVEEIE